MNNLNKCPHCNKSSLVLTIDAMDTRYEDGSEMWDSSIEFKILENGKLENKKIPDYLVVCDKDRTVSCHDCAESLEYPINDLFV